MERLISWWVNNPVASNLLMVGILLAGIMGFFAMEREAFPQVKPYQASIEVIWPGAAPQEVEEQIVSRIEDRLKDLDQINHIYSTAVESMAEITVTTFPGVDINGFLNDVKNAVDSVTSLPRDIENPRVRRSQFKQEMLRVAVHGDVSERELTRLSEDLRREVAALPWVSTIELFGTRREEVTIELSEASLRQYALSFAEVADAIRASSINLSSGQVRTSTGDVQIRARNLADTEQDFSQIIIRQSADGGTIRVGDVARVVDGFEDNEILATMNGQPAVLLQVQSSDNMQVVKASQAVRAWMKERRATLPEGIELSMWFDTADIYSERMELIGKSSYLGLALVFLVLILSLRPRVALWVTAGIGVAFVGTFAILPVNDVSLNIMSTFAFLLVLGIVVDDAIVVGESIHHHAHEMGGGSEAAVKGAFAVSRPVIFAVLTTMIAFAPWLFVSGEAAQVTRQLSIVITAALTISLIEAFLILPSHLRDLSHRKDLKGLALRQQRIEHSISGFAKRIYQPILRWAAERRYLTTSAFVGAFVIAIGLFSTGWVKFYFMPQIESSQIVVDVKLPPGTSYDRALSVLDQLQTAERTLVDEVDAAARATGEGTGQLIEGWYTRSRRDSVIAIVKLAPPEVRDLSARETAERLRTLVGDIPDADEIQVNYTLNDNGADITYLLRHRDGEALTAASKELQAKISSYNGVLDVRDSQQGETDEIVLSLKPGAETLGIRLADVSRQVRQAYFGEEVQRLPRANGDVKVMVRYPTEARRTLSSLSSFRVRTADGREVPLFAIADVELQGGVQRIQRRDGNRVVYVRADLEQDLISDIKRDIEETYLDDFQARHPGLVILKGGSQEEEDQFINEIVALYSIALFAMYALIAIAFGSYWLPLLIMTAIPFGFMGAIFGHLIFATPLALFSYFGIGAAAGVVVNDNLVLVDYIGRLREQGKDTFEAVIEAGINRFRPILLTTVTTFVGLIPIMAERSTNAQFLKPAVLSLSFGVLFALFVTLLLVPSLYLIGEDVAKAMRVARQRYWPGGSTTPVIETSSSTYTDAP
ncbi:efflux RND transporter permease subunit [Congregibacter sp.]|uniref:efflux RND transporter permease subunit n=1 Tax=Congregibacter sp. TaxID=2744308 RepID=UPI003F6C496F